jgi:hypothetical protein
MVVLLAAASCERAPANDPFTWVDWVPAPDAAPPPLPRDAGLDAPTTFVLPDAPPFEAPLPRDTRPPDVALPTAPAGSCLTVAVTTVTADGSYSPRNIGAIWIADAQGKFVKSLKVWANARIRHLVTWNMVTTAAGSARNRVDAITSATVNSHRTHVAFWSCSSFAGARVPDGSYKVCYEMTESNSSYQGEDPTSTDCVPFTKGTAAFRDAPPDEENFVARVLEFTPPP